MNEIFRILACASFAFCLISFVYIAYNSRNAVWKSFGFVYLLYSIPFLFLEFTYTYFGKTINVVLPLGLYIWIILLTLFLSMLCLIESSLPRIRLAGIPTWQRYGGYVSSGLIAVSLVAFGNDFLYWGWDLFLTGTADRWAIDDTHSNLFFISIDYLLLSMAGLYGLFVRVKILKNKNGRIFLVLFITVALVGVMQGHRYYAAIIFLAWLVRPGLPRKNEGARYAWSLLAAPILLVIAANINVISTYAIYYEYAHKVGLLAYVYDSFSWFPSELTAITTNTFIGYSHGSADAPPFYMYLAELIPFSNRVFNFSAFFSQYYNEISEAAGLALREGQGTGFSFYLESMDTHLFVAFLIFPLALLWRMFPNPIISIISFFISLNIIRNGAITAISSLKISLLIVVALYIIFWLGMQLRPMGLNKVGVAGVSCPPLNDMP